MKITTRENWTTAEKEQIKKQLYSHLPVELPKMTDATTS